MIIKKFDWLSPPITLYFKGEGQHSSIFSAILSIISYIFLLISGIYYSLEFINRENPKAYFFNRYIEDAGHFPINSSSMFNFIQISDTKSDTIINFDFSIFRVIGLDEVFYDEYMNNPNILLNVNHWIYGYCNNSTDTEGISNLINFNLFEQSACIRKYYDKNRQQYFNTGEEGFRWPIIKKGCSNPNRTYYGLILQRCDKTPNFLKLQGPECKPESEITEYIGEVSLKFQIIDHYADTLNYKMPFTKYFYQVTSAIINGLYIVNHLNFNPANMLTHNGIFMDNIIQESSYFFTQNEKHTVDQSILTEGQSLNGCLIGIYFWMQNTLQYYERNYDRLQDVLSDIGGVNSIVVTISYFINLLINNFIILLDTEDLILNRDKANFGKKQGRKRPTFLKKANEIQISSKKDSQNKKSSNIENIQKEHSSNQQELIIDAESLFDKNNINEENKQEKDDNSNRNNLLNIFDVNKKKENQIIKNNNKIFSRKRKTVNLKIKNIYEGLDKDNRKNNNNNSFSKNGETEESKEDNDFLKEMPLEKKNFNWFKYIWFMICCGTNDKNIAFYENLRTNLISEENIIQCYLDIYQLLKVNNIQKKVFLNK